MKPSLPTGQAGIRRTSQSGMIKLRPALSKSGLTFKKIEAVLEAFN